MKLKIPKPAVEAVDEAGVDNATTFADLGKVELYRGQVILVLEGTHPPTWIAYIFAIEIDENDDVSCQMTPPTNYPIEKDPFEESKKIIDKFIFGGRIIEQDNEAVYLPVFEERFFDKVKRAARHLARKAALAANSDVDQLVEQMQRTGGVTSYTMPDNSTVTGYVVEIYYDNRYRARSNDGTNGEANVQFPKSKREENAVYIVAKMTWSGTHYSVPGSVPMWRIR